MSELITNRSCSATEECRFDTINGEIIKDCLLDGEEEGICVCSVTSGFVGDFCNETSNAVRFNTVSYIIQNIFNFIGLFLVLLFIFYVVYHHLTLKFTDANLFTKKRNEEFNKVKVRVGILLFSALVYTIAKIVYTSILIKASVDPTFVDISPDFVDEGETRVSSKYFKVLEAMINIQLTASVLMHFVIAISFIEVAEKLNEVLETVTNTKVLKVVRNFLLIAAFLTCIVLLPLLLILELNVFLLGVVLLRTIFLIILLTGMLFYFNKIFKNVKVKSLEGSLRLINIVTMLHLFTLIVSSISTYFIVVEEEGIEAGDISSYVVINHIGFFIVFLVLGVTDLYYCRSVLNNLQEFHSNVMEGTIHSTHINATTVTLTGNNTQEA